MIPKKVIKENRFLRPLRLNSKYIQSFGLYCFKALTSNFIISAIIFSQGARAQDSQSLLDTTKVFEKHFIADTSLNVPQLDFKNADIRDVFNALAKAYNLNFSQNDLVCLTRIIKK